MLCCVMLCYVMLCYVMLCYVFCYSRAETGPEVIKVFSCSTQLSMNFFLLINVKMPTIVGILTYLSRNNSSIDFSEAEKY